ncbi:MAG: DUF4845 domain-containing protein [Betaproteobacteria bacterium]|nr:DUF4845 domain-containing protein [Betaproteobacteria bacterium]MSQ88760.1 DUF4845 domain-containing protein [Betaproteobacteria bacterium]
MHNKQLGLGLGGLLAVSAILVAVAMVGIKLVPSYLEFMAVKKVIKAVANEKGGGATVAEIRKSFDLRATVDNIGALTGADLEVSKEGNQIVVAAKYRKEIPLVANIGIHIDFSAVSKD